MSIKKTYIVAILLLFAVNIFGQDCAKLRRDALNTNYNNERLGRGYGHANARNMLSNTSYLVFLVDRNNSYLDCFFNRADCETEKYYYERRGVKATCIECRENNQPTSNTSVNKVNTNINTIPNFDAIYNSSNSDKLIFANEMRRQTQEIRPEVSVSADKQNETDARNSFLSSLDIYMTPRTDYPDAPSYNKNERQGTTTNANYISAQRLKYLEWYEANTPWYDKKLDKYNDKLQYGELTITENLDKIRASAAKGVVTAWEKAGDFVVDGVPKLITGQAQKELKAVAGSALSVITKGNAGKDEVEAGKGYYDALTKHNPVFIKDGGKLAAEAVTGNQNAANILYDNQSKQNEKLLETRDTHLESKGYRTPNKVINTISPQKNLTDGIIKTGIRKMENGDVKQSVAYLNGIRTKGNGTWLGFLEYKMLNK